MLSAKACELESGYLCLNPSSERIVELQYDIREKLGELMPNKPKSSGSGRSFTWRKQQYRFS